MVSMGFTSLVVCLLFVLHGLRSSSAHSHQGRGRSMNELTANIEDVAPTQKELTNRALLAGAAKKGLVGGRKMVEDKELRKKIEKEEELNGKTSKISGDSARTCYDLEEKGDLSSKCISVDGFVALSGKDKNASKDSLGGPEGLLNTQIKPVQSNTKPQQPLGSKAVSKKAHLGTSSKSSKTVTSEYQKHETSQKDESKGLADAADKIANLMRKDYEGMDSPRRNPPINNHEPMD
ncbi:unnamed protein product [Ilex paraguariensis]|uniref:Uncharacterized protein n=1 Tax=Ilex paraguariensis TaxID=185542 RepID=A0ABC8U216_9AQUA